MTPLKCDFFSALLIPLLFNLTISLYFLNVDQMNEKVIPSLLCPVMET